MRIIPYCVLTYSERIEQIDLLVWNWSGNSHSENISRPSRYIPSYEVSHQETGYLGSDIRIPMMLSGVDRYVFILLTESHESAFHCILAQIPVLRASELPVIVDFFLLMSPDCARTHIHTSTEGMDQELSRLCVQHVIWTPRTLFFDSLDTQIFLLEFADDDFS